MRSRRIVFPSRLKWFKGCFVCAGSCMSATTEPTLGLKAIGVGNVSAGRKTFRFS